MEHADTQPLLEVDTEFGLFFRTLSRKEGTIRTFDRNGFFSIHGDDARSAAIDIFETQAALKYSSGLPTLTISKAGFGRFLRESLFRRALKVEIWEHGRPGGWRLAKEASPGNVQAIQQLLSAEDIDDAILLAVQMQRTSEGLSIGASFADVDRRQIGLIHFLESDTFSNFETLVIQLGVKECLVKDDPNNEIELNKIKVVLGRCGVTCTVLQARDFGNKSVQTEFPRLLADPVKCPDEAKSVPALAAVSALISYLNLLSDASNIGRFEYWKFDLSTFMRLDGSALKALSLMPSSNDGTNKTMNLYGLLNQCRTPIGSRLLTQWLKQPLLNLAEIEKRHTILEYFYNHSETRDMLQLELKLIPDLSKLSNKFRRGHAGLEDVVRAYQVTTRVPEIISAFGFADGMDDDVECLKEAYLTSLEDCRQSLEKFQDLVETTVDLQALDHHEYLIRPDFDDSLGILRTKIQETREAVNEEHDRVADDLGVEKEKKLKLEQHTTFGYCLRLSRVEASAIRHKSEYKELQTAKAGVFFTTNKLLSLAKAYTELSSQYTRHQSGLVREVVTIAASYCPVFESLGSVIAHLDVMLAFAKVSLMAPIAYVRPRMNTMGTGSTILTASRHPCIEAQDSISFIPNDIHFVKGESEFLIITGANMGGKSTYIRQVGIITLMAQIGCFVPCESAEITIVDSILARVGAGDSQLKGISTFMSECLETAAILRSATKHSLIIIDELGRGTSTTDGYGLAYAISEHIVKNIGCFALFATHFHELTALSETLPTVKNLHVSIHIEPGTSECITLLYKVVEGACNQSFGIHVAELVGFPASMVSMAKRKLAELEQTSGTSEETASKRQKSKLDYKTVCAIMARLPKDETPSIGELRRIAAEVMGQ